VDFALFDLTVSAYDQGALCNPRPKVNEKFYGKPCKNLVILYDAEAHDIRVPDGTLLPEVYAKLEKLCSGVAIYEVTPDETERSESIRLQAEQEGEDHIKEEEVTYVVVEEEIRKENGM
jgi:hypothetical protein